MNVALKYKKMLLLNKQFWLSVFEFLFSVVRILYDEFLF